MDTKNIIIICLVVIIVVMAVVVGFLIGQQGSNVTNSTNVTNATQNNNTTNNTSSVDVGAANTYDSSSSSEQKPVDYNSPDSNYYRSDVDGSYHEKQDGMNYIYAQDAITGEWSYWADKS